MIQRAPLKSQEKYLLVQRSILRPLEDLLLMRRALLRAKEEFLLRYLEDILLIELKIPKPPLQEFLLLRRAKEECHDFLAVANPPAD